MSHRIIVTIGSSEGERPEVDERFLRRDYQFKREFLMDLAAGVAEDVPTTTEGVSLIYMKVLSGGPVQLYRNLSPEYWTFSDTWLMLEVTDVQRVAVKADVATTLMVYVAS